MTILTCATTGKSITLLGEAIANSGEGKIWRTDNIGYLAKIYHSSSLERVQKLAVMIAHPPKEPNSHLDHISFAWPKSVLKNAQGDYMGFLMPEIQDAKELIDIYNPQRRKGLKLQVDWRFLHIAAQNIASIIAALHATGYVLGDIKPQNILINNRALPSIIDTDSFQVHNPKNGKIYRCQVASPGYTPAELIGKDISSIEQTEVHDRFRLAVIIYQLLFGGESPFGGKWIGAGEIPENNELISRGLWLYAPNTLLEAVERTIPFEIVHPEIQRCFLRCFNDGYQNPHLRPTAQEWLEALKVASNELSLCGRIDSHYYSQTYRKCYWCDRSTKFGVDIFPGKVILIPQPISNPSIQNLTTGNQIPSFQGHSNIVSSVSFSPDGKTIASSSWDKTIKLWDVVTAREIRTFRGHSDMVWSVAFSPDGKILASVSHDKTIRLWDIATARNIYTLQGHYDAVISLAFSPDGKILATGSNDKTIKLWDTVAGIRIQSIHGHSNAVSSIRFSPDGKTLASGSSDKTIRLWEVATGTSIGTIYAHSHYISSIAYSSDGKTLASGSDDETIKLWNVATKRNIRTFKGHTHQVLSVAYSQDNKVIASGGQDRTIKLWDIATGKQILSLEVDCFVGLSLSFSPDGKTIASGADETIKIWKIPQKATSTPQKIPNSSPQNLTKAQKVKLWFLGIYCFVIIAVPGTIQYFTKSNQKLTISELQKISNTKIEKYINGIGISFKIDEKSKMPTITEVIEKSPAALENLQVGDQIFEVNGISTLHMSTTNVANLIQGDIDTIVLLWISRPGFGNIHKILVRKSLINPNLYKDYVNRCSARFQLKDYSNAINDCNEAVKINPYNNQAYFLRGTSHIMNGNKYQGMKDLRMAAFLGNGKAREILKEYE